jgi:hypothetical protein
VELRRIQGLELLDGVPEPNDRAVDDPADVGRAARLAGRLQSEVRSVAENARARRPSSVTAQTLYR